MFSSHFKDFIIFIYRDVRCVAGVLIIFKRDDKDASVVSGSVDEGLFADGQGGHTTTDDAEDLVVFKFLDVFGASGDQKTVFATGDHFLKSAREGYGCRSDAVRRVLLVWLD